MVFKKPKVFIAAVILALSSFAGTAAYAQSGYFNTYTDYVSMLKVGYFTAMQGMCVDRNNNVIYAAKLNNTNHTTQLFSVGK